MSFPNSSSAGLDGILPQILKDLTAKSNGQTGLIFLRALTNLVNVILEGKVPFELRPYFFGAELIELKKSRWRTSSYRCRQYIPPIVRKMCRILCLRITSSKIWKSTSALNAGAKRSEATCLMPMPQCCYLAKGAKRPSHTTNRIKFARNQFDPCNSIKRFDLCPFDQKSSTYLQPLEFQWEQDVSAQDVSATRWRKTFRQQNVAETSFTCCEDVSAPKRFRQQEE